MGMITLDKIFKNKLVRYSLYLTLFVTLHFYNFYWKFEGTLGHIPVQTLISKQLFNLILILIAEALYQKKEFTYFKLLLTYRFYLFLPNFLLPSIRYLFFEKGDFTYEWIRIFTREYLIVFDEIIMILFVAISAYTRIMLLRAPKYHSTVFIALIFIVLWSIFKLSDLLQYDIFSILVFERELVFNTNNLFFFLLNLFSLLNIMLYFSKLYSGYLNVNHSRSLLVWLYFLYSASMIVSTFGRIDGYSFPFIYSMILLYSYLSLILSSPKISKLYFHATSKLSLIIFSILLFILGREYQFIEFVNIQIIITVIGLFFVYKTAQLKKGIFISIDENILRTRVDNEAVK